MRRRTFLKNNYIISGGNIGAYDAVAGDICLYQKGTDSLVIIPQNVFDIKTYPSHSYTPVGVVVVPGSHNIVGNNTCMVMSLKEMNYSTPDTGSTSRQFMAWGQYVVDISNMTNYNHVVSLGTMNSTPQTTIQDTRYNGFLPSDKGFTGQQCPHDTDTKYYNDTTSSYAYIPSPYLTDDSRNPMYYQTSSPSSSNNAMSDFDGVGNTKILTDLATAQSDWKTASTITNNSGSGYSPAACCCWRYHTEGTKQGDWYLPAMGELGYIIPKFNKINQAINTLITVYGSNVGIKVSGGDLYWSSSEHSSNYARFVTMNNGNVNNSNKNGFGYVRAFLRVGA